MKPDNKGLDKLQKISTSLMVVLVLLTFIGANLHAVLWQSSQWLVSTVLPAVVVELTNEERRDNTRAPLVRNSTLDEAARMKAQHMAKHEYFSHYSPEGVSPWYWFDEAGYVYAHAAENLAVHFTDSSELVDAWMNSPSHRVNIVDPKYTEIGVGTAKGEYEGYETVYVVQLFGAPAAAATPVAQVPAQPLAVAEPVSEPVVEIDKVDTAQELAAQLEALEAEVRELNDSLNKQNETEVETEVVELPAQAEVVLAESQTETILVESEIPAEPEVTLSDFDSFYVPEDVVVLETNIATSSGLAVGSVSNSAEVQHAGGTLTSLITQPNVLLQMVYAVLSLVIVALLGISVVLEARRYHFQQVAYGVLLLVGMTGLLFAHQFLTSGAVVI